MLSHTCKYAIRAVLFLSIKQKNKELISGKEISEALKIPAAFTGKILHQLTKKKIISSTKGPKGGFFLSEENLEIPLIKIVESIDGLSFFTACGLGLKTCSETHPCPIHKTYKLSRDSLLKLFETKKIMELSKDVKLRKMFLVS